MISNAVKDLNPYISPTLSSEILPAQKIHTFCITPQIKPFSSEPLASTSTPASTITTIITTAGTTTTITNWRVGIQMTIGVARSRRSIIISVRDTIIIVSAVLTDISGVMAGPDFCVHSAVHTQWKTVIAKYIGNYLVADLWVAARWWMCGVVCCLAGAGCCAG